MSIYGYITLKYLNNKLRMLTILYVTVYISVAQMIQMKKQKPQKTIYSVYNFELIISS